MSTLAYNMFSQGINPELKIDNINRIIEKYERLTKMRVHERHPYAGQLVFTAFSGSHQDAINKGLNAMNERECSTWEVPYLPIDPADIGREYEPIVRINSQSGKGGVAFVMEYYFGYKLPKGMHREFAEIIQGMSEKQGEISPEQIMEQFKASYIDKKEPIHFRKCRIEEMSEKDGTYATRVFVEYTNNNVNKKFEALGNGPIDAVQKGLQKELGREFKILDYTEHALQEGNALRFPISIC